MQTPAGYTCPICKMEFPRIGQHISSKQCGDQINIDQFKKALKSFQQKLSTAKHKEKDMAAFREKDRKNQARLKSKKRLEDPVAFAIKNREKVTKSQNKRKLEDPTTFAKKHKTSVVKSAKKNKDDDRKALKRFQAATRYGPIFVCSCCYTRKFKENTVEMKKLKIRPEVLSKCVPVGQEVPVKIWLNDKKTEEAYVCKTCKRHMEKGKMPPECRQNNLQLDPQPEVMKLTELSSNLIARNIQFQKIYQLPKSRYTALKDKVINVPVPEDSVLNTVKSLPRTPNEAGLFGVELK